MPKPAPAVMITVTARKGQDAPTEGSKVDTSPLVSGPSFRICPLCEGSKLVFSGLNEARCPACDHEPSDGFLITLRQIIALPEVSEMSRSRPERELGVRRPDPKKENDEQNGVSLEDG